MLQLAPVSCRNNPDGRCRSRCVSSSVLRLAGIDKLLGERALLLKVNGSLLEEGRHPLRKLIINAFYRGVLGVMGAEKKKLFLQAQALMVERGFCTQEDADEGRALMEQQVKEAG